MILDSILKRLLMTPRTTPREVLYLETGMLDIEHTIEIKQVLALNRIERTKNTLLTSMMNTSSKDSWKARATKTREKYTDEAVELLAKTEAKRVINEKVRMACKAKMIEAATRPIRPKSKVKFLVQGITDPH